jgi:hypothetical protein
MRNPRSAFNKLPSPYGEMKKSAVLALAPMYPAAFGGSTLLSFLRFGKVELGAFHV